MTDERAELADAIGRLESALGALRSELERPDGESGDEPSPDELLRIADEVALPAMEATLLANRETLDVTRRAVAAARGGAGQAAEKTRQSDADDGAVEVDVEIESARDATDDGEPGADLEPAIGRVEAALDDLQTALQGSELPPEGPARDVVRDARSLRREIDDRVREATAEADRARRTRIPVEPADEESEDGDGTGDAEAETGDREGEPDASGSARSSDAARAAEESPDEVEAEPAVDVEAELETIKQEYARRRETLPDWAEEGDDGGQERDSEESHGGADAGDGVDDAGAGPADAGGAEDEGEDPDA